MPQNYDANKVFSMDQAIDVCLNPKFASYNFLPMILHIIVGKLNLENTVFALDSELSQTHQPVVKYYEDPEMYKINKRGSRKPIQPTSLDQVKASREFSKKFYKPDAPMEDHSERVLQPFTAEQDYGDMRYTNIEKSIKKIAVLLEKLTFQHEHLVRKFKVHSSMNVDIKAHFEEPKKTAERNISIEDKVGGRRINKKDIENVRKEFKRSFCELVKKVMKISNTLEEHKDAVQKIESVKKILDKVASKDSVDEVDEKVDNLCFQISKTKKDIGKINSHVQDIVECSKYTEKRIKGIQERIKLLEKIREILERLDLFDAWKKKIHLELEKFTEITEHLRIIKADREELDYLFEEKADRDELLKLVTLEFFKSVQDDISSGIVQVLEQLMRDEIEWEKAHKEIQLMIDAKADHCEMSSLKKYINCKLEIIQKKLNDIIRNKLTAHAAAVRIRLLKDARCITCTADADLNQLKYPVPMLGPARHYDVKCICEPRSRYYGGSHTVVGPDQKLIAKQKMPLKQATATTVNFTMTEGPDGNLYRTTKPKCVCEPLQRKEEEEVAVKKK